MLRRAILMPLAIAAALAVGAPAAASLSADVIPGRALAEQLKTGTTTCADLSTGDFQHIGDYVISRMTGSAQLHAAMSDRMRSVMGSANTERMRTLMGQRYAGCTVSGNVSPMMGPTMMARGWADDGTWGPMYELGGLELDARRQLAAHEPGRLATRRRRVDGTRQDASLG